MFDQHAGRQAGDGRIVSTYDDLVVLSAHDVAAELRRRLPGLPTKKLHKLLYYCQGHHLAAFGEPLFSETVSAWDMGPVVGSLWKQEKNAGIAMASEPLADEAALNTVGYVLSRYGALTGTDLENMSHNETPWKTADSGRRSGESARIEPRWMLDYFSTLGAVEADALDDVGVVLDSESVSAWLQGAGDRRRANLSTDDPADIRARLAASG